MTNSTTKTLVYGATGAQGRAVIHALLAKGAHVRALLRADESNPFDVDVEIARGDFSDTASLVSASDGIDRVALTLPLIYDHALVTSFADAAISAAEKARVKLVVFNASHPVPDARTGVTGIDIKVDVRARLKRSLVPAITIKPTLYMGNLTEAWSAPAIVHQGIFAYPIPTDLKISWNSWEDVANYVVAALDRPDLAGQEIAIGGPQAITGPEMADMLSGVIGKRVSFVAVPVPDFAAGLNAAFGAPVGDEIGAFYGWFPDHGRHLLEVDIGQATQILGVRPTSFADWAARQDWHGLAGKAGGQ